MWSAVISEQWVVTFVTGEERGKDMEWSRVAGEALGEDFGGYRRLRGGAGPAVR